jgi:hypothetical protein
VGSAQRIANYSAAGVAQLISMYSKPRGALVSLLPVILGITPNTGPVAAGTLVRITGINFEGVSGVTIGGAPCTSLIVGGGIITCYAPAGSTGAQDVVVTGPAGSATLAGGFTYAAAFAAPTITSLSRDLGDIAGGGQSIIINGTNLSSASACSFGGTAATITGNTSTTVTVTLPAKAAGSTTVTVTTPGGTSGTLSFEFWSPVQVTGISAYLDASKGVTGGAAVSAWLDQSSNARNFVQATGANKPAQTASVFGTMPSIRFTPQQWVRLGTPVVLASGQSVFAVAKWTASTTFAGSGAQPDCPLTILGDAAGGFGSFGTDAGVIRQVRYAGANVNTDRGSGLNDGNPRLIGATFDTVTNVNAYVGATQQGSTDAGSANDTRNEYDSVGAGASTNGWSGDLGAVVIVSGIISGGDLTKLNKWAQQRWGTP